MSYFGKFFLSGPDAQAAADWVFSNRMDGPVGKTIYTCMLNKRAGIEADLTVSIMEKDGVGFVNLFLSPAKKNRLEIFLVVSLRIAILREPFPDI